MPAPLSGKPGAHAVYEKDDESLAIWRDKIGVPAERIKASCCAYQRCPATAVLRHSTPRPFPQTSPHFPIAAHG